MNLAQLRVQLRDVLTAGGGTNLATGSDDFWGDSELNTYLNMAQQELYKVIRRARSDYFTRIIRSTDASLVIRGDMIFEPEPKRVDWGSAEFLIGS